MNNIADILAAFTTVADPSLTSILAKGSSDGSTAVAIPFKVFCAYFSKFYTVSDSGILSYTDPTSGETKQVDLRLRWDTMTEAQQKEAMEVVRNACVEEIAEAEQLSKDVAAAEALRVEAESDRVTAEEKRASNESERQSNETERQANEVERKANETERQDNESERIANEKTRQANETERQANETTRQSQETARETNTKQAIADSEEQTAACKEATDLAEELNSHPDYIGDDGYWYKWNTETDEYENTGKLGAGGIVYPTFDLDDDEMTLSMEYEDEVSANMFEYDEDEGELYFNTTAKE